MSTSGTAERASRDGERSSAGGVRVQPASPQGHSSCSVRRGSGGGSVSDSLRRAAPPRSPFVSLRSAAWLALDHPKDVPRRQALFFAASAACEGRNLRSCSSAGGLPPCLAVRLRSPSTALNPRPRTLQHLRRRRTVRPRRLRCGCTTYFQRLKGADAPLKNLVRSTFLSSCVSPI